MSILEDDLDGRPEGQILKQNPHDKLAKKLESFRKENVRKWGKKALTSDWQKDSSKEASFVFDFLKICDYDLRITKEQIQVLSLEELKELEERIAKKSEKILRRAKIALISAILAHTLPIYYATFFIDNSFFPILCGSFIVSVCLILIYYDSSSKRYLTVRKHLKGEGFSPEYIRGLIEEKGW